MKLKHWMESLSRARKKPKPDAVRQPVEEKRSSGRLANMMAKANYLPVRAERKHVRDNYPAVSAYLEQRNPLTNLHNLHTFRPPTREAVYDVPLVRAPPPNPPCACYRHQPHDYVNYDPDSSSSVSSTSTARRVAIRTNPWVTAGGTLRRPQPPPKPARKRPPEPLYHVLPSSLSDMEDKSVGTDGDEYLLEDTSSCTSSYCDCDECQNSGLSFTSETIQPSDDTETGSMTSTPTILNDFDGEDEENGSVYTGRDSAVDSGASQGYGRRERDGASHYSPADSHTSWKYFDEDDEADSGHGQTASSLASLASPGSAEDYVQLRNAADSSAYRYRNIPLQPPPNYTIVPRGHGKRERIPDEWDDDPARMDDLDSNIELIRTRLQRQVYQLKHEQTALERQMQRSRGGETETERDFVVQKKAILVETLELLKRQLDEQNRRLQTSYSALQHLQKHQKCQWRNETVPVRNRDGRALSALYNEHLRETFC